MTSSFFGNVELKDSASSVLKWKGSGTPDGTLTHDPITSTAKTWTLPDVTGTVALQSGISGTYTSITSITVTNGIITAISGT
jgi:hypothetical protein